MGLSLRRGRTVVCTDAASLDGTSLVLELQGAGRGLTSVALTSGELDCVATALAVTRAGRPTFHAYVPLSVVLSHPAVHFRALATLDDGTTARVIKATRVRRPDAVRIFAPDPCSGQRVRVQASPDGQLLVVAEPPRTQAVARWVRVTPDAISLEVELRPGLSPAPALHAVDEAGTDLRHALPQGGEPGRFEILPEAFEAVAGGCSYRLEVPDGTPHPVGRRGSPVVDLSRVYTYPPVLGEDRNGREIWLRVKFDRRGLLHVQTRPASERSRR